MTVKQLIEKLETYNKNNKNLEVRIEDVFECYFPIKIARKVRINQGYTDRYGKKIEKHVVIS